MPFDKVITQAGAAASLPNGTPIDLQAQTDGGLVQIIKLADGEKDSSNLLSVSADGAAKVDGSGVTQPISAVALPLPDGAATSDRQDTVISGVAAVLLDLDAILAKLSSDPATQTTLAAVLAKLSSDPATQTTLAAVLTKLNATLAVTQSGTWTVQPGNTANTTPWKVEEVSTSSTASQASVASSASSVSLLAANAARKMAMIFNDSTAVLYVFFGSSAATTSNFTVQIAPGGYYELPRPVYTGELRGIWASANGNARITELS